MDSKKVQEYKLQWNNLVPEIISSYKDKINTNGREHDLYDVNQDRLNNLFSDIDIYRKKLKEDIINQHDLLNKNQSSVDENKTIYEENTKLLTNDVQTLDSLSPMKNDMFDVKEDYFLNILYYTISSSIMAYFLYYQVKH
tara:strand:+ start:1092 stop:1511 length:420 start_codon:yes stop_codon:yes gene_type:complete